MNLRQQIIKDRVDSLAGQLKIGADEAFMKLVHSLVTGRSVLSFDPLDIVDGGQDKQMDVISIEEGAEDADVFILQTKNSASFSSNDLIQLANGLKWLFQRTRKDLDTLTNVALRDKILEYRALQNARGPSNVRIHVRFATNGTTASLSDEFKQEMKSILADYATDTFEKFSLEALGCDEIVELSKSQERQTRRVDADIKMRYDTNNPSLIKYYAQDLKGLVCSVPASEIARLVNDNPDGAVFDLNIRRFLGTRGAVNRDIQDTCTNLQESYEFWFLNNGITIVCDQFDPVTDPDNPHVKIHNLQIVNGCQTASTLALASKQGQLANDVRVLTRIYQTTNPDLVSKIVLTTNNQNRISSRDLSANDPVQIDMEKAFNIYGYAYERKPRQFEGQPIDVARVFTNEYVAQAYLAVVLKNPSDARARKYKVWDELNEKVFSGEAVEPYIIAAILSARVSDWLRLGGHVTASDETERLIAKRGAFHVSRISAFLWRGNDNWKIERNILEEQLKQLETSIQKIEARFIRALAILVDVIRSSDTHASDVDRAFKSTALDRDIDKSLYQINEKGA